MSGALSRYHILAVLYVAVSAIMVMWNIIVAGRISQVRRAPRSFAAISAIAGLLLVPALMVAYASATVLLGRAIQPVAGLWPLVTVLIVLQSAYAVSRRMVTPLFGVPIVVYNVIIAIVAVTRFAISREATPPDFGLALSAAQANALGFFFGAPALWGSAYLQVPVIAPALPARWKSSGYLRAAIAGSAAILAALVIIEMPNAFSTIGSYAHYEDDQLQEHPEGDFALGLKILPDLRGEPPPLALERDITLADSLDLDAVMLVIDPE
ncbi:MAG: hypothetical protein M3R07_02105, partial [Gemmatimonadota bacterium]|nr:hypothetical protein [Gemmatimonadota bacterium]